MSRGKWIVVAIVAVAIVIQFFRPAFANPPVNAQETMPAVLPVPQTVEAIFERSCYDCHSNTTRLPWYSTFAPVSWLLARDVNEGRRHLSFSTFAELSPKQQKKKLKQICDEVKSGDMPPWFYTPMHRGSKLTDAEKQTVCAWTVTVGAAPATTQR